MNRQSPRQILGLILSDRHEDEVFLYGISPTERLRRQLREAGCIHIVIVNDAMPIEETSDATALMIVSNRLVLDDRILTYLASMGASDVRLRVPEICTYLGQPDSVKRFFSLTGSAIKTRLDAILPEPTVSISDIESYVLDLRLHFEPYVFAFDATSDIRSIENHMYEANFKGTLDFIATYVYKYPVREITRYVSKYPWLTPNLFTAISITASFLFPVLFAMGYVWQAVTIGWIMFIADSVDGKLARLTVRLSRTAGLIEHATSAPAIFLWFLGMGWHFSDGMILDFSIASNQAMVILLTLYWLDKLLNGIFRSRYRRDMYDFTAIDRMFHLIACRRAIIWFFMFLGLMSGHLYEAFVALASWMVISFLFHFYRLIWLSITVRPGLLSKMKVSQAVNTVAKDESE